MWAELSVIISRSVTIGNGTLKMIFKGTGCFQFLEAVVTSTAKESLCSTERGSLQVLVVL